MARAATSRPARMSAGRWRPVYPRSRRSPMGRPALAGARGAVCRSGAGGLWITRVAKSAVLASVFRAGSTRGGREGTHGSDARPRCRRAGWGGRRGAAGCGAGWWCWSGVGVLSGCQSEETPPATTEPVGDGEQCVAEPECVASVPVGESVGGDPRGGPGEVGEGSRGVRPLLLRPGQPAWTTPSASLIEANSDGGLQVCASLTEHGGQGAAEREAAIRERSLSP